MFDNIMQGMFGKIAPGLCKITMNGETAVKCSRGYKAYNVSKGTLTNVTNFCFSGDDMFFVIPTNKVEVGDIIFIDSKPKCVINVDKKVISVIDYENSEIRQVVPERHIFMGNVYFYGKIVSVFGNMLKKGKGTADVMKMMMMSQLMGGGDHNTGMGQMMAMSMFMGGKDNPFDGMFDLSSDEEEEAPEEEPSKSK